MKINIDRLMTEIEYYGGHGFIPNEGVTRPSFSEDDYTIREILVNQLVQMGLVVRIDPIANIFGKLVSHNKNARSIVIGSHLDTVPNGGKFDGALGVLVAKEIIQTLQENNVLLNHHLEIVSFTGEEANDFNLSTMGSRALTGKLDYATLVNTVNSTNEFLSTFVKKAGGDLEKLAEIKRDDIAAYLELHIEQGKRLENNNLSVGVVNGIVGIYRDIIIIEGEQNHAGTTMMEDRSDALVLASEIVLSVERIAKSVPSNVVATIGKLTVFPNTASIIPGRVELILEIRSVDKKERQAIVDAIYKDINNLQEKNNVNIISENLLDQQESIFDEEMVEILQNAAESLEIPFITIPSMAGHDATHLTDIAKTAMVFVKSIGGKSHCHEELSLPEDIEKATNTMLHALLAVDKQLDQWQQVDCSISR